jgi:predicted ArsR family transcriptional regulator
VFFVNGCLFYSRGMTDSLAGRLAAAAALDEPTRRQLYDHVVRQAAPVGRDEVAAALGIPRATVAFHLDKLVAGHLLEVTFQRRTGRSGPGAGRPAKLYQRSAHQLTVSIPERHYELAGQLLAAALEDAEERDEPARTALNRRAREYGQELGTAIRAHDQGPHALQHALETQGFEPRTEDGEILLGNCPFHSLATAHTDLVCGMNLDLLDGLLSGLGEQAVRARLRPTPGQCCVRLSPA